jgi:uncharacterized protein YkwD
MFQRSQRLTAVALAMALLCGPSTFAENRTARRTDLRQLEADLERVFGKRSTAPASRTATEPRVEASHEAILDAMNRERTSRGLVPLRMNAALSRAAQDRVQDMLDKRYFAHVSPDGIDPFTWALRHGYRYRMIGENLASGYRGTRVVDGWMNSPGHRANILQQRFDEVGIAIAGDSPRSGTRGPLVVAMYGTR